MNKRKRLAELLAGGMPVQEAAKKLNISKSSAYEWKKALENPTPSAPSAPIPSGEMPTSIHELTGDALAKLKTTLDHGTPSGQASAAKAVLAIAAKAPPPPPAEERPFFDVDFSKYTAAEIDAFNWVEAELYSEPEKYPRRPIMLPRDQAEWGLDTAEAETLARLLAKAEANQRPMRDFGPGVGS